MLGRTRTIHGVLAALLAASLVSRSHQATTKRGTINTDAVALRSLYRHLGRPEPLRDVWMSPDPCALASNAVGLTCALLDQPEQGLGGGLAWHYVKEIKLNSGEMYHFNFSISGSLPGSAFTDGQLSRLQYLDISYSALSGNVPEEISNLVSLTMLALSNNQINGSIPASLSALTNLMFLDVSGNNLTGTLPPSLSSLSPSLQFLNLMRNQLYGSIPLFLTSLSRLIYLDLGYNQLSLGLPGQLSSLTNLTGLYFPSNLLSGPIPTDYGNFKSLVALKISNNQLSGNIPESLTKVTTLQQLILNDNQLSGQVPLGLADLPNLKVLSLQNNQFQGSVGPEFNKFPQGFLFNPTLCANLSGSGYQPCTCSDGSSGQQLCTLEGPQPCQCTKASKSASNGATTSNGVSASEGSVSTAWIVIITIGAGLLAALLAVLGLWGYRTNFGRRKAGGWEYSGKLRPFHDVRAYRSQAYDPDEIDSYSVSAYDPSPNTQTVGGAHGRSTTSSTLAAAAAAAGQYAPGHQQHSQASQGPAAAGQSSTAAAFARKFGRALNNQLTMRQFSFDEVQLATNNFSPDNVVTVEGSRKTFSGVLPSGTYIAVKELEWSAHSDSLDSFAAAVEIFSTVRCPQLAEVLGFSCGPAGSRLLVYELMPNGSLDMHLHDVDATVPSLDWTVRMSICLQVAKALGYLHSMSPQMVHQSLQASTVLLDDHLNAKVSDYCLLSLRTPGSTSSTSSTNVAVAAGTAAPELAWSSLPSVRSDVYAFGVLLLEVISGRRPINSHRPPSEQSLVRWAKPRLSDRAMVGSIVDPRLNGSYSTSALHQVTLLASQCIQTDPESRPSILQAIEVLQNIQNLALDGPSFRSR